MTIKRLLSLFLVVYYVLSAFKVRADQIVVSFTEESLFEAIDSRCASIRLSRLALEESEGRIIVAKNAYTPDVSLSWEVGYLGNGLLTDRNFSGSMGIHNPHFVNNFALEAIQMIYTGGATRTSVKLAQLDKRIAELSVEENRQQLRFLLLSNLIDLDCLNKQVVVIQNNIDLAERMLQTMLARHSEGVLLKSDITRYQLQISDLHLQKDRLQENICNLNHRIAVALDYSPETTFFLNAPSIDEDYPLPEAENWQQMGFWQNTSVQKAKLGIDLSQAKLRLLKAEKLPKVGAFAYGRFNSPITIEVPVLNKNFIFWGFGLNVSYNVSSLFKTGKKENTARLAIQQSQTQLELVQEGLSDKINSAYNQWLTACSELRTRRSSLRLAQENYSIVSDRFNEGMALVTDLVDAANVLISAQTGVENAKNSLLFCLYRLQYLTNSL